MFILEIFKLPIEGIIHKIREVLLKFFTSSSGLAFSLITFTLSLHLIWILGFISSLFDPFDDDFSLFDTAP